MRITTNSPFERSEKLCKSEFLSWCKKYFCSLNKLYRTSFLCYKKSRHTQGDRKASVHLVVSIQKSGAQRRFDHPV